MSILLTGAAGFIGFHVTKALLERGDHVVGIDNLNDYYDVRLKEARLAELSALPGFTFAKLDVADRDGVLALVQTHPELTGVIHLAAQAGVRYSLENPYAYIDANVMGTIVLLEAARRIDKLSAFTYASSSSVYGANRKQPFSVDDPVDQPVSLYAATKRSCELIARSYSHLYSTAGNRAALFYGLWAVGAAGHGGLSVHPRDPGRRADQGLQRRPNGARLHLHRRHCRRHDRGP